MNIVRWTVNLGVALLLAQLSAVYAQTVEQPAAVENEVRVVAYRAPNCGAEGGCSDDCRQGCHQGCPQGCPGHGNGPCPPYPHHGRQRVFGPAMRQALAPADQPYFGLQPLFPARDVPYGRAFQARFPRLGVMLVPSQHYMTVKPPAPMPTYTTRGPRDFLHPNPPGIGY